RHFVFGHDPKPALTGAYGSSCVAPKRLGNDESAPSVRIRRSRRNSSVSSSDPSARSGVSRQSWMREARSSASVGRVTF
ncbi:MAG: hypothetical protein AABZ26_06770, partial [Chloroflexota bacterium]